MSPLIRPRSLLLVLVIGSLASGCSLLGGATPTASPATPSPTIAPTASPTPSAATPAATPGPCDSPQLVARITMWDGAAGSRIASVELTNTGSASCTMLALLQPQLVDGSGAVLIDGVPPTTSAILTVGPGGVLKTQVRDGNYCGPPGSVSVPMPVAPVTVAFVFPGGLGRIVATPLSATDTSGVPPCNSAPGSVGDIEMQPWAP